MDILKIVAKAILTHPEDKAKRLSLDILNGVKVLHESGQITSKEATNFRKSWNRTIRKELEMIFKPDFSASKKEFVEDNRRFFELLEARKSVVYVEAVADPYQGCYKEGEDSLFYDILKVVDRDGQTISMPTPVFLELIGDPAEILDHPGTCGEDDPGYPTRPKMIQYLQEKGIDVTFSKRAGIRDMGFFNAFWHNRDLCLMCFGKDREAGVIVLGLLNFKEGMLWKIYLPEEDENLSLEGENMIFQSLAFAEDGKPDLTVDEAIEVLSQVYKTTPVVSGHFV